MRRNLISAAALLLVALSTTGCGDDTSDTATTDASSTTTTTTTDASSTTTATTAPETTEASSTTAAAPAGELTLTSPAFADGGDIPVAYTCDGANDQMELSFGGIPAGTTSLALTVVDPDGGDWLHWVIWNIPPDAAGLAPDLPAGDLPDGSRQGANDYADVFEAGNLFPGGGAVRIDGWDGPCPGASTHRYVFTLYALTGTIDLPSGTPGAEILTAIEAARNDGSLLGSASLLGLYPPG